MSINQILKSYLIASQKRSPDAGFVTWTSTPPAGVSYATHKFSLLDAFETAVVFAYNKLAEKPEVKGSSYWIVVGRKVTILLASLPQFVPDSEDYRPAHGLCYLGNLGNRPVFLDADADPDSFMVGNDYYCASGKIQE